MAGTTWIDPTTWKEVPAPSNVRVISDSDNRLLVAQGVCVRCGQARREVTGTVNLHCGELPESFLGWVYRAICPDCQAKAAEQVDQDELTEKMLVTQLPSIR